MEIKANSNNIRLDIFLTENTQYTRSKAQKMIKDKKVLVNNEIKNKDYIIKENDIVIYEEPEPEVMDITPENIKLDIIYEDEYLVIINKKSGMVVHPAVGNYNHTLVNALLYHFNIKNNNTLRPGIVHRIDKDTSGLLVVAKDEKTHALLSDMIKEKQVERKYLALVWGILKHDNATIDAPIGRDINNRQKYTVTDINSKDAITHFSVLERRQNTTLLECKLDTGRTHQIRVHLNYINHSIVNDPVYSNKKQINPSFGQLLHSKSIKFKHTITNKELFFETEPPKEFLNIMEIVQ